MSNSANRLANIVHELLVISLAPCCISESGTLGTFCRAVMSPLMKNRRGAQRILSPNDTSKYLTPIPYFVLNTKHSPIQLIQLWSYDQLCTLAHEQNIS